MSVTSVEVKNSAYNRNISKLHEFGVIKAKDTPNTPLGSDYKFDGCFLPLTFVKHADRFKNFKVREDDVWIISYPKTGTTWTIEMTWILMNELDYENTTKISPSYRIPYLEFGAVFPIDFDPVELANRTKSPRIIKTHLPIELLPDQIWTVRPKIIYVSRNPKDTAVSYYHHHRAYYSYEGDINEFAQLFMNGSVEYGPFKNHVRDFWRLRNEKNILFTTFEEMKEDLSSVIKKTSLFLGKNVTDDQLQELTKFLSFESMKSNYGKMNREHNVEGHENYNFFRKGNVGSANEELSEEVLTKFDDWTCNEIDVHKIQQ